MRQFRDPPHPEDQKLVRPLAYAIQDLLLWILHLEHHIERPDVPNDVIRACGREWGEVNRELNRLGFTDFPFPADKQEPVDFLLAPERCFAACAGVTNVQRDVARPLAYAAQSFMGRILMLWSCSACDQPVNWTHAEWAMLNRTLLQLGFTPIVRPGCDIDGAPLSRRQAAG